MNIGRFAGSSVIFRNSIGLGVGRLGVDDRDVEVLQPGPSTAARSSVGAMLARLPQVEHRLHAVGLQLREMLDPRLTAGAELRVHLQEVRNRRQSA